MPSFPEPYPRLGGGHLSSKDVCRKPTEFPVAPLTAPAQTQGQGFLTASGAQLGPAPTSTSLSKVKRSCLLCHTLTWNLRLLGWDSIPLLPPGPCFRDFKLGMTSQWPQSSHTRGPTFYPWIKKVLNVYPNSVHSRMNYIRQPETRALVTRDSWEPPHS